MDKQKQQQIKQQEANLSIIPSFSNGKAVKGMHRYCQDIVSHIKHLFTVNQIHFTPSKEAFKEVEKKLPLLHLSISDSEAPTELSLSVLCFDLPQFDISQFLKELTEKQLFNWNCGKIISTKKLTFQFEGIPSKDLFFMEILALIDNRATLQSIKEQKKNFIEDLSLALLSPAHAKHLLNTKGFLRDPKTEEIDRMIMRLSKNYFPSIASDLFVEMHHFFLARDDEFRRMRNIKHICRTICCLAYFKKQLRAKAKFADKKERLIEFKLKKTALQFPFSKKNVLSLSLSVNFISDYEKFEKRHILHAIKNSISNIHAVPHSFFHYTSSYDSIHSYYIEVEKNNGDDFSIEELVKLKENLTVQLPLSIELLSHRIFMPHNEEEILRNILALSREVKNPNDPPQLILNFQGQTEHALGFRATIVRPIIEAKTPTLESNFSSNQELITWVSGSTKIVESLKEDHVKEASSFILECPKTPFLRQDHSIDLLRARGFIVSSLKKIIGDVRDYNGGLIGQQNQLLNNLKEALSPEELKYEFYLDSLFHSIYPVLMKSLLSPGILRSLFGLFLELNHESETDPLRYREKRTKDTYSLMVGAEDTSIFDEIDGITKRLKLKELDLATTQFRAGSILYKGFVLNVTNQETIDSFADAVRDKLLSHNQSQNSGQVLKISLPRPTSLLDPRIATDRTSGIVIKMLYEGLMRIDTSGKPARALAESYHISEDQKYYTFKLRHSLWSNGTPVTAYDFEYAWKKLLDPHFKSFYTYLLYPIKNAKAAKKGHKSVEEVGIYAKDSHTLCVELEHPAPYFLELTANWIYSPLCKEVDQKHPGWAYYGGEHFVCNGPFRLSKWKQNAELQVVNNPYYWDAAFVHLKRIDISIIEDPKEAFKLYQKGELDWIGEPLSELPPETFQQQHYAREMFSHPIDAVHWFDCNVKSAPFKSKKCRKALAIAINRQDLIDDILHGGEQPAYSILPSTLSLLSATPFRDNEVKAAQKLFEEGLKEQGLDRKNMPPVAITCYNNHLHETIAHQLAKQWGEIFGISFYIETLPWKEFMDKCLSHDYTIMNTTWYSWFHDPSYNLEIVKHASGDMNATQWHNPAYTELLQKAVQSSDPKTRRHSFREAETIVMDEMPIIPLFYYTFKYMKKEHVNNIFISHLGQLDFKWAYLTNG